MPKQITIDREHGMVIIEGRTISSSVFEKAGCGVCGGVKVYSDDFDAFFCPECNRWLEGACGDPNCSYCQRRPKTPLPIDDSANTV